MTLTEIKAAHKNGLTVCVGNNNYRIIGKNPDDLLIQCVSNGSCIGLTHRDQVTMNGEEADFFILSHPMTPEQQAEYDAAVAFGSITPGTPVVPYAGARRLTEIHGLPNGKLRSAISIWIDKDEGRSVAVAFSR